MTSNPTITKDAQPTLSDPDTADLVDATILLVDDNVQNLELMQAYLESLPCRLLTARDGNEAFGLVTDDPPDLILLDVMMPRMSGFELCQEVRGTKHGKTTPIILMSDTLAGDATLAKALDDCGTATPCSAEVRRE